MRLENYPLKHGARSTLNSPQCDIQDGAAEPLSVESTEALRASEVLIRQPPQYAPPRHSAARKASRQ